MKLRIVFSTLALGMAGLIVAPAQAQTLTPCEVYLCMAGIASAGLSGGSTHAPALAY